MRKLRLLILLLVLSLLAGLCGAGFADVPVQTEGIEIPVMTEDKFEKLEIPDNEALNFVRELKVGWNLGNSFDAWDGTSYKSGLGLETYWCHAAATKELIHTLKEAGFNLIRIPVSWHNHVMDENYTVDPVWMNRVHEVAQWAYDEGMYFIINVHHDENKKFFYPDSKNLDQSLKYLTAVWGQIADAFADFDNHCILESMNEPRLVGTSVEWWLDSSSALCRDSVAVINQLNQAFVDLVRSKGGNNAERYLLVPGYCASPEGVLSKFFEIPKDSADNKIILEVHAYRPYSYALDKTKKDEINTRFDYEKDKNTKMREIRSFMTDLYKTYVSKGIPVIIDEFGVLQKTKDDLQSRVNFAAFYIACASARGMTCCWWDNHAFSGDGERFGIISRVTGEWKYPDIALAMTRNCLYNRE